MGAVLTRFLSFPISFFPRCSFLLPTHPVLSLSPLSPQECFCSFPPLSCFSRLAAGWFCFVACFALRSCSSACQGWVRCAFSTPPPFPFFCFACLLCAPPACSLPLLFLLVSPLLVVAGCPSSLPPYPLVCVLQKCRLLSFWICWVWCIFDSLNFSLPETDKIVVLFCDVLWSVTP